jgi:DNA polymerase elongation subunit (family B)
VSLAAELASLRELDTTARVLTFDIETQRAIVETFSLFSKYTPMQRVLVPARILCLSARWRGEDKDIFHAAWDEDDKHNVDPVQYEKMLRAIWKLLDAADIVVTYNGDRFDLQWVEAECARLGMGRPAPYKSVDLFKIVKRRFKAGLMSCKLEWSARYWLHDGKVPHGGSDLWHDIRHGTRAEQRAAQKVMREYCIHDVVLTERLLDEHLPWTNLNIALYRSDPDDEVLRCTKCGKSGLTALKKKVYTAAYAYQAYKCQNCGSVSRGKRSKLGTELRSVT